MNHKEFANKYNLTLTTIQIPTRSDKDSQSNWDKNASHWNLTLAYKVNHWDADSTTNSFTVEYSQGSAHKIAPKIEDFLQCLQAEAQGIDELQRFEEWAEYYGLDTDSRSAEKIFNSSKIQTADLREFLLSNPANLTWDEFLNLEEDC